MTGNEGVGSGCHAEQRTSGFPAGANRRQGLDFSHVDLGQCCPQQCPRGREATDEPQDALGEPLTIAGVARLMGCSVWTVRQRYLPSGLPYFRIGRTGKLTFYRNQVVRWVLETQQRKGGRP